MFVCNLQWDDLFKDPIHIVTKPWWLVFQFASRPLFLHLPCCPKASKKNKYRASMHKFEISNQSIVAPWLDFQMDCEAQITILKPEQGHVNRQQSQTWIIDDWKDIRNNILSLYAAPYEATQKAEAEKYAKAQQLARKTVYEQNLKELESLCKQHCSASLKMLLNEMVNDHMEQKLSKCFQTAKSLCESKQTSYWDKLLNSKEITDEEKGLLIIRSDFEHVSDMKYVLALLKNQKVASLVGQHNIPKLDALCKYWTPGSTVKLDFYEYKDL
jgi:hypothetical protein